MLSKKEYQKIVTDKSKKSKVFVNCIKAFLIGGAICTVGQVLITVYQFAGMGEEDARTLTSVTLIFLGVLVTALGLYDNLAKHAGAGSLVPITGFANAVSSPAIEFKTEGFVLGVGAKMFVIAGPVIVYGVFSSVMFGVIYWALRAMGIMI